MTSPSRAFLGTGLIGGNLALAANERGGPDGPLLHLFNRSRSKADAVRAQAVHPDRLIVHDTAAQAVAKADLVHLALTADTAVDAVLGHITSHLQAHAVVLDHSTTSVDGTRDRAERLATAGVAFLHAPVFMSPASCRSAQGILLVAGPQHVYDRIAEHLTAMSGEVWFTGTDPISAAVTKLMGNASIVAAVGVFADAQAIAAQHGVPPQQAMALFGRFNAHGSMMRRATNALAGDLDARWSLQMARKDVGLMLQAAADRPLAVLPGVAARMDDIMAQHSHHDLAALVATSLPQDTPDA